MAQVLLSQEGMTVGTLIPLERAATALGVTPNELRSRADFTLRLHVPAQYGSPETVREYVEASLIVSVVRSRVE